MAVHAHPDDEASSTGGILAKYAGEGVRTVLVTCTNGELGDGEHGAKPGEPGHDEAAVVTVRRSELEASCQVLGVSHLELLGYHDSGMMGWPQNDAESCFWQTPVETAAARLAELMDRYRPAVVVTYDDYGFYGHPDHIQAHRITVAALAQLSERAGPDRPAKLYFPTFAKSAFARFAEIFADEGTGEPGADGVPSDEDPAKMGTPDELVTTYVDCTSLAGVKRAALACHASQTDNISFLRIDEAHFVELFGTEAFVRAQDSTDAPLPENDLFAGLR